MGTFDSVYLNKIRQLEEENRQLLKLLNEVQAPPPPPPVPPMFPGGTPPTQPSIPPSGPHPFPSTEPPTGPSKPLPTPNPPINPKSVRYNPNDPNDDPNKIRPVKYGGGL